MFAFTILAAYGAAGAVLTLSGTWEGDRGPERRGDGLMLGMLFALIATHGGLLTHEVILDPSHGLGIADVVSVIAWLLAAIGLFAAWQPGFRLVGGIVLGLAAAMMLIPALWHEDGVDPLTWQIKLHAVLSLVAYSFLIAGAVLAFASMMQERLLRRAKVNRLSSLLPPLIATEQFLATLTAAGFVFLLLSVVSVFLFVENLFAQHLMHKTVLSLIATAIFGGLVLGRQAWGLRGKRMVRFYLIGFTVLILAYFGSKFVLEVVLGQRWG